MTSKPTTVKKRKWIGPLILTIVCFVALFLISGDVFQPRHASSPADRRRAIAAATPLLTAIQHYVTDTGHAPPTLNALVPKYLPSIPEPVADITAGHDYLYSVDSGKWSLAVPLRGERNGQMTYTPPDTTPETPDQQMYNWSYDRRD